MNTTKKGDKLENKLYEIIKYHIDRDDFSHYKASNLTLYRKKSYYSSDRKGNITFDVVVEVSDPNKKETHKPHAVLIFECKNYNGSLDVNEIETFLFQVRSITKDIGNVKPIIVTNARLQSGAENTLIANGCGYIALSDNQTDMELDWVLQRSTYVNQSSESRKRDVLKVLYSGIIPECYQLCCFDKNYFGYNFHCFFGEILQDEVNDNKNNKLSKIKIPYYSQEELENMASSIRNNNIKLGIDFLQDLACQEKEKSGLSVYFSNNTQSTMLGSISFDKNEIIIYQHENQYRNTFTLAHELAHYYLKHGDFIKKEYVSAEHFDVSHQCRQLRSIEYQANTLAVCLLMPKTRLLLDLARLLNMLDIQNKGFGILYLDEQKCNIDNYTKIIHRLQKIYKVSHQSLNFRLQNLGVLKISDNFTKTYRVKNQAIGVLQESNYNTNHGL